MGASSPSISHATVRTPWYIGTKQVLDAGKKMGKKTVRLPPLKFSFFFHPPKLRFSKSIYIMYIDVGLCLKRWAQRQRSKFVGLSVSKSGQTHISYYLPTIFSFVLRRIITRGHDGTQNMWVFRYF